MEKKLLQREARRIALTRMEDGARTEKDFREVVKQWNHLDRNRERRERYNEVARPNAEMLHWDRKDENDLKGKLKEGLDTVVPPPLAHHWWRQLMRGDFIDTIYDCPSDMWQLVEDEDISMQLKALTDKQKVIVYLRAVRLYKAEKIATYQNKTDRAIRKLYVAALERIREKIAPIIQQQIAANAYNLTFAKRRFNEWYESEIKALDNPKNK